MIEHRPVEPPPAPGPRTLSADVSAVDSMASHAAGKVTAALGPALGHP